MIIATIGGANIDMMAGISSCLCMGIYLIGGIMKYLSLLFRPEFEIIARSTVVGGVRG